MAFSDVKKLRDILELEIKNSSNVFVVGHNNPDFDSLGSCIGLARMVKEYGKDVYIIVDDLKLNLQSGIVTVMDSVKDEYSFIKKKDLDKLISENSLLLISDVNKKSMISIGDMLDRFGDIVVIDHHTENEDSVITPYKFIDLSVSSTSEVVTRILTCSKIKYDANVANALLAGIELDTKRFRYNTSPKTHDAAEKLQINGANDDEISELFLEEFDDYCRVSNLIVNGTLIYKYSATLGVSFTLNRNEPKQIYQIEDCAKAACKMFSFKGIDAAFTLGYISDDEIHVSARGNGRVDVSKVMMELDGGGNATCAGAKITSKDIFEVEKELMKSVKYGVDSNEKLYNEPKLVKEKRIKR